MRSQRPYSKSFIIEQIQRIAEDSGGKAPGRARFEKLTGIKDSDWLKYWATFTDAVIEAGYKPQKFSTKIPDEFLIKKLIELINEKGHFPSNNEVKHWSKNDSSFPSHSALHRLGKRAEKLEKVIEYCRKEKKHQGAQAICEQALLQYEEKPNDAEPETDEDINICGYVYLGKMDKYYKIGHSQDTGRRRYDIGLKLPKDFKIIHEIPTDDPQGIEKYWHKRFESKRTETEGEWFDLDQEDIRAFKRRKYFM